MGNNLANEGIEGEQVGQINSQQKSVDHHVPEFNKGNKDASIVQMDVMKKISDFVDQLRLAQEENDNLAAPIRSSVVTPGHEEVQRGTNQVILQAEKFRAEIEKPPGRQNNFMSQNFVPVQAVSDFVSQSSNVGNVAMGGSGILDMAKQQRVAIGTGFSDNDFFHLICHIIAGLKAKIEKGQFVDLDKLLPKERNFDSSQSFSNETKLKWVQSDGSTYLVPARKTSRINCFRRWKQAFRMYATIYCTVHPQRAREIWQYISVINTASMSYSWDNVYNYDITFRQLMEFNPNHSWAVTYNQMWNLAMTNPIIPNQGRRGSFSNFNGSGNCLQSNTAQMVGGGQANS